MNDWYWLVPMVVIYGLISLKLHMAAKKDSLWFWLEMSAEIMLVVLLVLSAVKLLILVWK